MNILRDSLTAPDGWTIQWNLTTTPQTIDEIKPDKKPAGTTSGSIDIAYLQKRLTKFRKAHYYTQLTLF